MIIPLIGQRASLENLAYAIYKLETGRHQYAIFGVSHGYMNETKGLHGILMYANNEPALVNGDVLRWVLKTKYGYNHCKAYFVTNFVWVSCYIEDQYETYGDASFPGFFDKKYSSSTNIPPEYQLDTRPPSPPYDDNKFYFRLYGRGVTTVPQEAINFLDQTIKPFSFLNRYNAAIRWGSRILPGYLNIKVELIPSDFDVSTWTVLDSGSPEGLVLEVRSVKAYVVNISAWAETGSGTKTVSKISEVQSVKSVVRKVSSGDEQELTALERVLITHPTRIEFEPIYEEDVEYNFVEPFDAVYEYFVTNATGVAEKIAESSLSVSQLEEMLYTFYADAKKKLIESLCWLIDQYALSYLRDILKKMAIGIVEALMPSVDSLIGLLTDDLGNVAYLFIKAQRERISAFKGVMLLVAYGLMSFIQCLLDWLGKGLEWFIEALGNYLNLPSALIEALKDIVIRGINHGLTIVDNALAAIKGELKEAIESFSNIIGSLLNGLFSVVSNAMQQIGHYFRDFLRVAYELLANPLYSYMLLSGLSSASREADGYGKIFRWFPSDNYDFVKALSVIYHGWNLMKLQDKEVKELIRAIYDLPSYDRYFYVAQSSFAIPILAKWYLNIMETGGVKSMYAVLLTHHLLVDVVVNGELKTIWLEQYYFGDKNSEIGDPGKLYAILDKRTIAEINKWHGVSLWNILGYVKICLLYTSPSPRDRG